MAEPIGPDDDLAVPGPERGKRRDRRVARADRARHLAQRGITRDRILEDRDLAVEHAKVDFLATARLVACDKCQ